jgi:sensor c-di-GMP phosphodiesterase-like protein
MRERNVVLMIVAAVLALIAPILLSLYLARQQALRTEEQRALLYAQVILKRSEHIADLIDAAFRTLVVADLPPCSKASLKLMRRIQLTSGYIDDLGYMYGNRLQCMSAGSEGKDLDLGPAMLVAASGTTIRTGVRFPFAPGAEFTLIGRGNYVAVIHNEVPIDVISASKGVVLGIFSVPQKQILVARGKILREWIDALQGRREVVFETHDHVIAIVEVLTSLRYEIGAVAALPTVEVNARVQDTAKVLVPLGVAASVILMLVVFQISRTLVSMPALIKAALKGKEFSLNYQPVVDLRTGKWVGAEALIRWRQPRGGMVRPDLFIPIAEDYGLIQRVTERVIEILADDAATIFRRYPDFHIGINLAPADLHSTATIERLKQLAQRAKAKPGNLMVETTERSLLDLDAAGDTIRELKRQGFRFAIDDFGIGYSSLSYLGKFDFDLLKIDKSFVEALDTGSATSDVVPHIIEMAKTLNLEMIAEGVETEAQALFLREHGVQYAQGWLYAKVMTLDDLLAELDRSS